MSQRLSKRFFVTGTDTDVGKTFVTCAMLKHFERQGIKALGFKPISAGCEVDEDVLVNIDAQLIQANSNVQAPLNVINPIAFEPPIAPHIAAAKVGKRIDFTQLNSGFDKLQQYKADVYLVEGAGGWLLPINETDTLNQWVEQQQLEVILVVGVKLGCLNHALLTAQAIESQGLTLAGWVANIVAPQTAYIEENIEHLKMVLGAPLLARVPYFADGDSFDFDKQTIDFSHHLHEQ